MVRFVFYTLVAASAGLFAGTVPIEGRTLAERAAGIEGRAFTRGGPPPVARPGRADPALRPPRAAQAKDGRPADARPPHVSAGAANAPEAHDASDRRALDTIIAARARRR